MSGPSRRLTSGVLASSLATALAAAATPACRSSEPARSAIIIVVDALRPDHLGAHGYHRSTSPHLDARAREGRVFERAYSTSTWTLPSFASLHTGRFPTSHRAGMAGFDRPDAIAANRLPRDVPTLAERLAAQGLVTGAAVNNPLLERAFGLDRGFQTYDHPQEQGRPARRADEMVDRALSLIDGWGGRPFFLVVHFVDPHMDYDAPAPFGGRFSAAYPSRLTRPVGDVNALRQQLGDLTDDERDFITAAYDEEIAFVDQQFGRLWSGLAARGLLGRSTIVLTADHGEELFDHGGVEHGHAMWEEVVRVPLIVWGPGVQAGRESSPVSLADIAPTLLEWAAAPAPADLDGVSLWRNLTTGAPLAPRTLLAEGILYGADQTMMLRWPWKVVVDERLRPVRATDLSIDPQERTRGLDVAPEAVDQLVEELRTRQTTAGSSRPVAPHGPDPGVLERLRSLGYIR